MRRRHSYARVAQADRLRQLLAPCVASRESLQGSPLELRERLLAVLQHTALGGNVALDLSDECALRVRDALAVSCRTCGSPCTVTWCLLCTQSSAVPVLKLHPSPQLACCRSSLESLRAQYDARFDAGAVKRHLGTDPAASSQPAPARPSSASVEQAIAAMRVRTRERRTPDLLAMQHMTCIDTGSACRPTAVRRRQTCPWRQITS